MASPARPAAAFGIGPDAATRCSFDQTRRREDFQDNRLVKSFVNIYDQDNLSKEIIIAAIESCMNKQADNLLHSLESINGRLSQLELYCYKLERSIGELRSDVMDYHSEANLNFRGLQKHLQEVQKSVQIVQDKQDLAETQKELSKLQLAHKNPTQKNEGSSSPMQVATENNHTMQVAKHELAFVPLHQVNAEQSPAMQFQSCSGLILQQLVPVSLSTQGQQHLNQATVCYMQSQSHVEHAQTQPSQAAVPSVQPQVQNPQTQAVAELHQMTSQAPEIYPQAQQQWLHQPVRQVQAQVPQSQPQVVPQQQYNVHQVPPQIVQLQTSPQAQSTPQVAVLYPAYGSHLPANATIEPPSRSTVVQPSYSSPQRKHYKVVSPPVYAQSSIISLPPAEHNIQHQQPQLQLLNHGSFGPQPGKLSGCSAALYTMQGSSAGSVQTHSVTYRSPSNSPATVVAVVPQHTHASAPLVFHHLEPQAALNHPFGEMAEKAAQIGYPREQVESMALRMSTTGQPVDFNAVLERLTVGSNGAWSG